MLHPECDEDLLDLLKVEPVKQKIYKQKKVLLFQIYSG